MRKTKQRCKRNYQDVSRERALFAGTARPLRAGKDAAAATALDSNHLYSLELAPAGQVTFAVAPGKTSPTEGTYAGILAFSAVYEMLEAASASILTPQRLEEFVGMQGDPWDSQEDMLMAGLGSVVAVIAIALIRSYVQRRRTAKAVERELAAYGAPRQ